MLGHGRSQRMGRGAELALQARLVIQAFKLPRGYEFLERRLILRGKANDLAGLPYTSFITSSKRFSASSMTSSVSASEV